MPEKRLSEYRLDYKPGWDEHFRKMDRATQERLWKKIQQQKYPSKTRHLKHGVEFYVAEAGQYRIAVKIEDAAMTKTIWFAGDHKQYERWYKSLLGENR